VSGNGHATLQQHGDYERKFMVSEPGSYTLSMPIFSGFEPVPPQTIDVAAGQFTEHVIELTRRR
jgi:hypothetical protein